MGKRILASLLALMLIFTMLPLSTFASETEASTSVKSDIDGHWSKKAIETCVDYDIMNGYNEGVYKPNNNIRRAEFAIMVNRAFGYDTLDIPEQSGFTDIKAGSWYAQDMYTAIALGVINGVGKGKSDPAGLVTREQAATILSRVLRLTPSADESSFKDYADVSSWAKKAVLAMEQAGYMNGSAGRFRPKSYITRGETAQLLTNVFGVIIDESTDENKTYQNVTLRKDNITLKNATINGDLFITEGVADGDIWLDNVKVEGRLLATGGGENSINVNNVSVKKNVFVDKPKASGEQPVRFRSSSNNGIAFFFEGKAKEVIISNDIAVICDTDSDITVFNLIDADEQSSVPKVVVSKGTEIDKITINVPAAVEGDGKVNNVEANSGGIELDKNLGLKPEDITTSTGVETNTDENGNIITDSKPTIVGLSGIEVDPTSIIDLKVGYKEELDVTYTPTNATNKKINWVSDDDTIASVDANGVITGKKVGTTTITGTSVSGNHTATCDITVIGSAFVGTPDITGTFELGETLNVDMSDVLGGTGEVTYTWKADGVAISGATGASYTVQGSDAGKIITCEVASSSGATYTVSAAGEKIPFNISLNVTGKETGDSLTIDVDKADAGDTATLTYALVNKNINNYIRYTGVTGMTDIVAHGNGTSAYTVNSADATNGVITISATFVHIDLLADPIAFTNPAAQTKTYGDAAFTNAIQSGYLGTGAITYSSSDTSVATVNATSGEVTILKAGSTTITATKADDTIYSGSTATYSLTVAKATPTIILPTASQITYGETLASSTLTGGSSTGTYAWETPTTMPPAGINPCNVVFTPTDSTNYISVTRAVNVNVQKKAITVTGFSISKVYDGTTAISSYGTLSFSGLVNAETATVDSSAVTLTYSRATVGTNISVSRSGTFSLTGSGDKPANTANYSITQPSLTGAITLASPSAPSAPTATVDDIKSKKVTLTAPTDANALFALEYAINTTDSAPATGWQDSKTFEELTKDTTYYFFARYKADATKNNVSSASESRSIKTNNLQDINILSDLSITGTTTSTFDNTAKEATVTYDNGITVEEAGAITIIYKKNGVVITPAPKDAGTYEVYIKTAGGSIYDELSETKIGEIIISKATITGVTASVTGTATYGSNRYSDLTLTTTGTATAGSILVAGEFKWASASDYIMDSGSVTKTVTFVPTDSTLAANLETLTNNVTFTVNKKDATVTGLSTSNKTYDTTDIATLTGTARVTGIVSGDDAVLTGTAVGKYADANAGAGKAVTITGLSLTGDDAAHYNLVLPSTLTSNINKASVTISQTNTAEENTFSPLSLSLEVPVTVTGLIGNDTLTINLSYKDNVANKPNFNTDNTATVSNTSTKIPLEAESAPSEYLSYGLILLMSAPTTSNYQVSNTSNANQLKLKSVTGESISSPIPVNQDNVEDFLTYIHADTSTSGWSSAKALCYKQTSDLDLTSVNWQPIANFRGNYNGNFKTISNLTMVSDSADVGLFANLSGGAGSSKPNDIKNVILKDSSITGTASSNNVGGIVGRISTGTYNSSTIENCAVIDSVITGLSYVGGIVGNAETGNDSKETTITACYTDGIEIYGTSDDEWGSCAGGIVATLKWGNISNCSFNGTIEIKKGYNQVKAVGGIVGYANFVKTLTNCFAEGNVSVTNPANNSQAYVGGIVGYATNANSGIKLIITNCVGMLESINIGPLDLTTIVSTQPWVGQILGRSNSWTEATLQGTGITKAYGLQTANLIHNNGDTMQLKDAGWSTQSSNNDAVNFNKATGRNGYPVDVNMPEAYWNSAGYFAAGSPWEWNAATNRPRLKAFFAE